MIADRITVLRDGAVVRRAERGELTEDGWRPRWSDAT